MCFLAGSCRRKYAEKMEESFGGDEKVSELVISCWQRRQRFRWSILRTGSVKYFHLPPTSIYLLLMWNGIFALERILLAFCTKFVAS